MSNTEDSYGHQNSYCDLQYYETAESGSRKPSEGTQSLHLHKEVPIVKRNNVIRNTAVTYIRIAILLKINVTELQKWYDSLFIDNITILVQGY